jgi:hypothetical protein
MSVKNIKDISLTEGTVSFETKDGDVRTYSYGKQAILKIVQDGRDPAEFKSKEVK